MPELRAPLSGTVVKVAARGDSVHPGTVVVVLESMKMEYPVEAGAEGVVADVHVAVGATVGEGELVATITAGSVTAPDKTAPPDDGGSRPRAYLAAAVERHRLGRDEARPAAVAKRRRTGQRTARENVEDLLDVGSFVEYGPLAIAAQRRRRSVEDLIASTPADGLIGGIGTVAGHRVAVLSYDYTVLAGTQGFQNHRKKDRLFDVIERERLPVVFFTEGGGGRPGDTDVPGVSGLDCLAFWLWGGLSGLVPMIGITSGRCFAGNAAILGCCDVIIATQGSNIGMGGPAMVEGGGLGTFAPEQIGPLDVQVANGVVDVAVADEAEAVAVARRYLAYFTTPVASGWTAAPQEALRDVVPESRRQVYDVRAAIHGLTDTDSVLELRSGFAPTMVTALARVDGHALGIVANNPMHLAGAIDADGADKASRFLHLCDVHGLPVLFLCDTPGIMVGPDAEREATVRHASRLFVAGAHLSVPFGTIVLRKGYGLGAQAMAGGSFKAPLFCVAWPTGELGGMGLEGAVRLGFRKELEAIDDPDARDAAFAEMVERLYEHGRALNAATYFEIDDVIDPADSRRWITTLLLADRARSISRPHRPALDPW